VRSKNPQQQHVAFLCMFAKKNMALILSIETSTNICSAALARDGKVLGLEESFEDKSHASQLTLFIQKLLHQQNLNAPDLDAVSISQGPGSYTGLRIGVSVAKGICYAVHKPLIAVNTLKAIALMAKETVQNQKAFLCPMIDARRMDVYSALFSYQMEEKQETRAEIIDHLAYQELLETQPIVFFGNGAEKCKEVLIHPNALILDGIYPSAKYMAILAEEAFKADDFKDVAYFEPFYLKDFVATVPKNKLF